MKNVVLKNGEEKLFVNEFNNKVGVRKSKEGYYIFDLDQEIGPFLSIYCNMVGKGATICGYNRQSSDIVEIRLFGFGHVSDDEIPLEFKKLLRIKEIERVSSFFPECEFVDDVLVYRLAKLKNSNWEKRDGYTRLQIPDEKRFIFRTATGKYFSVNPKRIEAQVDQQVAKPMETVELYDSFEEMQLRLLTKRKMQYSEIKRNPNRHLADLFRNLYFSRNFPKHLIQKLLDTFKENVGIEEFMALKKPVEVKLIKHKRIRISELADILKKSGPENMFKYIKFNRVRDVSGLMLPVAIEKEIAACVNSMPAFDFSELKLMYNGEKASMVFPYDLQTQNRLKTASLYEWEGLDKFFIDQPEGFGDVIRVQLKKYEICSAIVGEKKKPTQSPRYFDFDSQPAQFLNRTSNDDGEEAESE